MSKNKVDLNKVSMDANNYLEETNKKAQQYTDESLSYIDSLTDEEINQSMEEALIFSKSFGRDRSIPFVSKLMNTLLEKVNIDLEFNTLYQDRVMAQQLKRDWRTIQKAENKYFK